MSYVVYELVGQFETIDALREFTGTGEIQTAAVVQTTAEKAVTAEVDADGFPYDETIHTGTKAKKADGRWKARKGAGEAEKKAREKFLAKGGANPPSVPGMPGMPEMPGSTPPAPTQPERNSEPVSFDQMVAAVNDALARGIVEQSEVGTLYQKAGSLDPSEYQANETLRRKLVDLIEELDEE